MVNDTISSPRSTMRPSTRLSSLCIPAKARAGIQTHMHQSQKASSEPGSACWVLHGSSRTSSADFPFLGGSLLNSSESASTRLRWRSNAMNLHPCTHACMHVAKGMGLQVMQACMVAPVPDLCASAPAHNLPAIDQRHAHACMKVRVEWAGGWVRGVLKLQVAVMPQCRAVLTIVDVVQQLG